MCNPGKLPTSRCVAGSRAPPLGSGPVSLGTALVIQGSSALTHTLLAHGLIDRINLLVYPVLLGKGKRFFSDDAKPSALKLESSKTGSSGVTVLSYTPSGPVKTGSFATGTPCLVTISGSRVSATSSSNFRHFALNSPAAIVFGSKIIVIIKPYSH